MTGDAIIRARDAGIPSGMSVLLGIPERLNHKSLI